MCPIDFYDLSSCDRMTSCNYQVLCVALPTNCWLLSELLEERESIFSSSTICYSAVNSLKSLMSKHLAAVSCWSCLFVLLPWPLWRVGIWLSPGKWDRSNIGAQSCMGIVLPVYSLLGIQVGLGFRLSLTGVDDPLKRCHCPDVNNGKHHHK